MCIFNASLLFSVWYPMFSYIIGLIVFYDNSCFDYYAIIFLKRGDPLTMGYFDNLGNESLNKYKIDLKNEEKIIDVFFYL
jgi:hypothetical protein